MNDGGSAFPISYQLEQRDGTSIEQRWQAMSLLDWFAGQLLQGATNWQGPIDQIVKRAFDLAEMALAESQKRKSKDSA